MEQIRKIILTRGIPASGKTTWAKQWVSEDPNNRVRISCKEIRDMLVPNYHMSQHGKLVMAMSREMLRKALSYDKDVVMDDMNLSYEIIDEIIDIAGIYSASIIYQDFRTPLDICIQRDAQRPEDQQLGEITIRKIYEKYEWFYE